MTYSYELYNDIVLSGRRRRCRKLFSVYTLAHLNAMKDYLLAVSYQREMYLTSSLINMSVGQLTGHFAPVRCRHTIR